MVWNDCTVAELARAIRDVEPINSQQSVATGFLPRMNTQAAEEPLGSGRSDARITNKHILRDGGAIASGGLV
jgi:hypothetical protein